MAQLLLLTVFLLSTTPRQLQYGSVAGQIRTSAPTSPAGIRVAAIDAQDPKTVASGNASIVSLTQTDAAGRYRLDNIPPGRYFIMAGFIDAATYYPGTASLTDATPVEVRASVPVPALDFSIQRSVGVKVSGKVTADPRAVVYAEQLSIHLWTGPSELNAIQVPVAPDGSFEFSRVPPGKYTARVFPGSLDYSTAPVEVGDRDVTDVRLTIPYVVNVKTRVFSNGIVPRFALAFTDLSGATLTPLLTGDILATPGSWNESILIPLPEGVYRVTMPAIPAGFELKSILQGNIDLQKETLKITAWDTPQIAITLQPRSPAPGVKVTGRVAGNLPAEPLRAILSGPSVFRNLEAAVKEDGTFEFPQVFPGTYRTGLIPNISGTPPISVDVSTQDVTYVEFALPRTHQVRGQWTTDNGSPAPRFQFGLGYFATSTSLPVRATPTVRTDGTFNVTLPEGEYAIGVEGLPAGYRIKALTYGDDNLLQTRRIRVAADDSKQLLVTTDFTSPSPWMKVSGRVQGQTTSHVILVMSSPMAVQPATLEASLNSTGSFEFPRVAPGRYALRLSPPVPGGRNKQIVVTDQDIRDLEMVVPVTRTLSGHAEIEGSGPLPRLSLSLVRTDFIGARENLSASVQRDGSFTATVPEGEYRVTAVDVAANYRIQSLTYGSVDLMNDPLKIDSNIQQLNVKFGLTNPASRVRLSGHVTGAANFGDIGGRVLMRGTGLQLPGANLDQDGNFTIPDVAPGTYVLQAIPQCCSGDASFVVRRASLPTTSISQMPSSKEVSILVGDKDVQGVELVVSAVQRLNGRLVVQNNGTIANEFALTLTSADEKFTSYVRPAADGKFTVVFPLGEYTVAIENLPTGYVVTSVRHGSTDILKTPLKLAGASDDELQVNVTAK